MTPGVTVDNDAVRAAYFDVGVGPGDARSPTEVFVKETLRWLKQWIGKDPDPSTHNGVALFILDDSRPLNEVLEHGSRHRTFSSAALNTLGGNVFACSANLSTVFVQDVGIPEPENALGWLDEKGLASATAVIFVPRRRQVLIRTPAMTAGQEPEILSIDVGEGGPPSLLEFFELFYKRYVETHTGGCSIWVDPDKRKLVKAPERTIQRAMATAMQFAFEDRTSAFVRTEVESLRGRKDIEVLRFNSKGEKEADIIELKVLFPSKSDERNMAWACCGVLQACRYAASQDYVSGKYTICFDGRKVDRVMPKFFELAKERGVVGKRYFMETPKVERKFFTSDA